MFNFEEELKRYEPTINIDEIENEITNEDMEDVINMIKCFAKDSAKYQDSKNNFEEERS